MSALFESQMNVDTNEYNKIGFNYELSETEKQIAKEMDIDIVENTTKKLKGKYKEGKIDLYITKKDNHYTIHSDGSDASTYASTLVETYFNTYKEILQQQALQENDIDANQILNIITLEEKVVEEDNFFASYIKNYAFLFIIMAITVSATSN